MKTKQQRKITLVQLKSIGKKLPILQRKQVRLVKQLTPLKGTVRKYIQQNMVTIKNYFAAHHEFGMIGWAVDKINRGYFGDVKMGNLREIIRDLEVIDKWTNNI